jgi:hypothetical protein
MEQTHHEERRTSGKKRRRFLSMHLKQNGADVTTFENHRF